MSDPERDRDARTVADLQEFAAVAASIVARGRQAFFADDAEAKVLGYAARTVVVNVSAAADRLSQGFRDAHPQVPWRAVRDTRNRVAHDYDGVNDVIVWTTLAADVPRLTAILTGATTDDHGGRG